MNKSLPLITVNMLTYNNFIYLEQALESVFSQTYPNIELIISDDGSTNFDLEYIEELCSRRSKNIQNINIIHHENNIGTVKNFNNGINVSKGEYLIGLSSDDIFYDNNVISNVVNFFIETGADIVTCKRLICDSEMKNELNVLPEESDIKYLVSKDKLLYQRLCYSNYISGACTYYSKKIFDKYGLFDEKYNLLEDYPFYLKLAREEEKIYFYNGITVKYRLGGVSTSGINPKLKLDSLKTIKEEILPFVGRENINLYNWKSFEYDFAVNNSKLNLRLFRKYPKEVFLKIINKSKLIKISPEDLICRGGNDD